MRRTMLLTEEGERRGAEIERVRAKVGELSKALGKMDEHLLCPITRCVFEDPVILEDGFTYERDAIERWLASNNRSPSTNAVLRSKAVVSNIALRQQIQGAVQAGRSLEKFLEDIGGS